jgi:hypothetical protein
LINGVGEKKNLQKKHFNCENIVKRIANKLQQEYYEGVEKIVKKITNYLVSAKLAG